MTKTTCENDIKALDDMIENGEYDHKKISTLCRRYGLVPPEEETAPEDPEELMHWMDPFEGIAPVVRVLAKEYFYTNFTDRKYILKGGVRTFWGGHNINNEDCDDELLEQLLAQGLNPLLFLTYPGKE